MKDGALVSGGVAAQTTQAVENLKAQLASMGATIADVAKTLCFLTDMDTFGTFNEAYAKGFGTSRPARSTIGVKSLPFGGAVEIEAWAFVPAGSRTAAKKPAKKSAAKKPASKKPAAKKVAAKRAMAKTSTAKKSAARKPAARKKGR